jgi:hypothetical protein
MAVVRVVSFDGVDQERMDAMAAEMSEGQRPEGVPASEIIVLHDPDSDKALAILFFENEDDYRRGHEVLDAMPAAETPGQRTAVSKYAVVARATT